MGRNKVHVSSPERQRAYRVRRKLKLERYDQALVLLAKARKVSAPDIATEIEEFLRGAK